MKLHNCNHPNVHGKHQNDDNSPIACTCAVNHLFSDCTSFPFKMKYGIFYSIEIKISRKSMIGMELMSLNLFNF